MKMSITERQPFLTKHFAKLIRENKLVHAYLLSGAEGTGKIELAKWVAKGIFCLNSQNGIISIMINIKKAMACLSEQL